MKQRAGSQLQFRDSAGSRECAQPPRLFDSSFLLSSTMAGFCKERPAGDLFTHVPRASSDSTRDDRTNGQLTLLRLFLAPNTAHGNPKRQRGNLREFLALGSGYESSGLAV
jgi:hypothetical protein